ncbi:MAG: hypothetical protein E6Q28_10215 [Afipia sp.]|nr:MAG: hypothetical protein E6Q28_10215 [Afipia sp.]
MIIQPLSDGSHMPQQMVSRVERIGPKQPMPYDKARCAKARDEALKKQREALDAAVMIKADASPPGREKLP